jgi:uncharacterized damage-inducible protein DinB
VIDEMIHTLEYTIGFMDKSVDDLSDEEMVQQPSGVPNHATWTLGHVIFSCQEMAAYLGAERWLPDDWESVFGYGSTPRPEGELYPQRAGMQRLLADANARLCHTLRTADTAVLGRQLSDEDFPTTGHVLLQVIVAHTAYHAGQLAMWRRALGKESVAVFV